VTCQPPEETYMNPKAKKFNIHKCMVCNYKFSDAHHIYPQNKGGETTIYLCPNHHRYANMVQVMLQNNGESGRQVVSDFAIINFDNDFNDKVLPKLIDSYYYLAFLKNREFEPFYLEQKQKIGRANSRLKQTRVSIPIGKLRKETHD
jgi:hypothetical protein